MDRRDKQNYYLDIAETVMKRGTCLRRSYGSIIVSNDEIIATGYNGAPRGRANCNELGYCLREKLEIPRGQMYEICRAVHSEANAIVSAARRDMIRSTLYMVGREAATGKYIENIDSCPMCKRLIINAGIERVIVRDDPENFRVIDVSSWVENDDLIDMSSLGY